MLYVREGVAVKTYTYTETRARLAAILNVVADNREEVIVSRPGKEDVVILALGDYESMRETAYLLRSPANARRLFDAIDELNAGGGQPHELVDTE